MPNIYIACIGKLKEKYFQDAQAEYARRLSAFCRLTVMEKKEAVIPKNASASEIGKARAEESAALMQAASGTLIAMSPEGEKMSSEAFANLIQTGIAAGDITFAVGGSHGLHDTLKKQAGKVLSFSDMTLPHQLFRIVLLEQIYRAFMISSNRTYHK